MRLWSLTLALLLFTGLVGDGDVFAQSDEERPVYLYTGQGEAKNFAWTDPEEGSAYVFREPVPKGETGGRMIPERESKKKSSWPSEGQFVGRTPLTASEASPFGVGAIRTENRFPSKTGGEKQRYLLVIEAEGKTYCSRTLEKNDGNYPRYHTLGDPAAVRVGPAHSSWNGQAEDMVKRARKWAEGDTSSAGTPSSVADTSSEEVEISSTPTAAGTAGASGTTSAPQASGGGLLGWVPLPLQGVSWTWWGGSGVFGLLMFLVGMSVGGGRARGSSGSSRGGESGSSSRSKSRRQALQESNLPGDQDESSETSGEVEQIREELREAQKKIEALKEDILRELRREEINPMKRDIAELEERLSEEEKSQTERPPSSPTMGPAEKVAEAFESWCRQGSGVRKISRFERHLQEQVRGAEVQTIQYEQDAMGDEFVEDARNGITYWLVTLDGQRFALPRPVNRSRFESLRPVYEGDADPSRLDGMKPAALAKKAGNLVLDEEGHVW